MSSDYISEELRQLVSADAEFLCEYCLIHEGDTFVGCQVDHIISEKHGGASEPENLAFAARGAIEARAATSHLSRGTLDNSSDSLIPRTDRWNEHFNSWVAGSSGGQRLARQHETLKFTTFIVFGNARRCGLKSRTSCRVSRERDAMSLPLLRLHHAQAKARFSGRKRRHVSH